MLSEGSNVLLRTSSLASKNSLKIWMAMRIRNLLLVEKTLKTLLTRSRFVAGSLILFICCFAQNMIISQTTFLLLIDFSVEVSSSKTLSILANNWS